MEGESDISILVPTLLSDKINSQVSGPELTADNENSTVELKLEDSSAQGAPSTPSQLTTTELKTSNSPIIEIRLIYPEPESEISHFSSMEPNETLENGNRSDPDEETTTTDSQQSLMTQNGIDNDSNCEIQLNPSSTPDTLFLADEVSETTFSGAIALAEDVESNASPFYVPDDGLLGAVDVKPVEELVMEPSPSPKPTTHIGEPQLDVNDVRRHNSPDSGFSSVILAPEMEPFPSESHPSPISSNSLSISGLRLGDF